VHQLHFSLQTKEWKRRGREQRLKCLCLYGLRKPSERLAIAEDQGGTSVYVTKRVVEFTCADLEVVIINREFYERVCYENRSCSAKEN